MVVMALVVAMGALVAMPAAIRRWGKEEDQHLPRFAAVTPARSLALLSVLQAVNIAATGQVLATSVVEVVVVLVVYRWATMAESVQKRWWYQ
jgi:hypothetical protein